MSRTVSEREFEEFCHLRGIPLARIPEAQTRTPDYEISLDAGRVVVEVKETSPNPDELESERLALETGCGNAVGGTPGDRVRKMIASASGQLKARSQGLLPTLLVVFDQGRVAGHVDNLHIRAAMYGLEQIYLAVPSIGHGEPYAIGTGLGPKRKMTESDNTSISAIGALVMTGPGQHILYVYRNRFAKVPLEPGWLQPYGIQHFDLAATAQRASDWVATTSEHEP